jgi:predicted nucleic acid-binding Zn ribbon protein
MPIYEYEYVGDPPEGRPRRFEHLQSISSEALAECPETGAPVRRVVSRVSVAVAVSGDAETAARHGFTTYRKTEKGLYEKQAGAGPDMVDSRGHAPAGKVYDLDKG